MPSCTCCIGFLFFVDEVKFDPIKYSHKTFIIGFAPEFLNTEITNHFPNRTLSYKTHHLHYKNFGNTGCLKQHGTLLTASALNKAI